jgi:nucleotide-binding universal stress UspA family protein
MTPGVIQHIVCAVRGGAESHETADHAIELALGTRAKLTFFHVIDLACLDCGDIPRSSAAYREFLEQAESAMRALSTEAERRGVTHVGFVVREGDTRQELGHLAVETDAELMVLGHPRWDAERSVFTQDEFRQFLAELDFGGELRTVQVGVPPIAEASDTEGGPGGAGAGTDDRNLI